MGALLNRIKRIDRTTGIIKSVLEHFHQLPLPPDTAEKVSTTADLALNDALLFEKFEMWVEEKDDEIFLFHISRFLEKQHLKPLHKESADLTRSRTETEASIKNMVRNQQKRIFGQRVTQLAVERKLLTNDMLGDFLDVSGEQARKFKSGENKPHLATLEKVADRFKVSVSYLVGLNDKR